MRADGGAAPTIVYRASYAGRICRRRKWRGEEWNRESGGKAESGSECRPRSSGATCSEYSKHTVFAAPRALTANELLNSAALRGNYIDATLMPDTSEILRPPSTRVMADAVRVDGLTIAGAAQTLDGIRWKDVTFVGTRLRYEGGEVSLQKVHFKNCTFGFSTNDRGARLADAIALGQQSFVMQ
jgi:hypothetical protein